VEIDDLGESSSELPGFDRAGLLKRIAVGSAALSIPALATAQGAFGATAAGGGGNYPKHPKWKFAFVNHVTTNPFFVPTHARLSSARTPGQDRPRPTSAR